MIVYRLEASKRLAHVAQFRTCVVTLEVGRYADSRETITGTLTAVASGSPSDVAIVQVRRGYYPRAIPLAAIATIRTADVDERTALEATNGGRA